MMAAPTAIDQPTRLEDRFVAAFEMQNGHTLNGNNANVQGLRREAIQAFAALGFPTRKAELWKYTNIEKVLRHDYRLLSGGTDARAPLQNVKRYRIPGLEAHVIVLVNGHYDPDLSSVGTLPEGVLLSGFARASSAHPDLINRHFGRYADFRIDALAALNTAFTQDGAFVYVPRGVKLEKPVHVISITDTDDDVLVQPRHLFVAEEGTALSIIQSDHVVGQSKTFVNAVTEIYVGARANVDCYKLQDAGDDASGVDTTQIYQEEESICSTYTATLSGGVVRNTLRFLPDAEGCESHLYGLSLAHGHMHVDNHTLVDHAKPNCESNEMYKSILDENATGVFNGKVFVRPDAQKTNAYQSNKSIVLKDTAKMYTKPELEIYADDVRCSHGATTGQLDAEAIFYLRSRGISESQARAMMMLAFARDVLDNIKLTPLREMLDEAVHSRFAG